MESVENLLSKLYTEKIRNFKNQHCDLVIPLRILYILGIILWTFAVFFLNMCTKNTYCWIIILGPYLIFAINLIFVCGEDRLIESQSSRSNTLTFMIVVFGIYTIQGKPVKKNSSAMLSFLSVLFLYAFSLMNIWHMFDPIIQSSIQQVFSTILIFILLDSLTKMENSFLL